jgi:hypothetical protein
MPEFSKLIDLPVTRLFRPHLQSLRNIATSDMSEEGTFSVQIGHIHYKAKSLDELLANPLPASIDNFSLHVYNGADPPKLDSNRRLSIDLRSYRSSCFISSHDDEIWFNGKSQQITDFFAAHIP